MANLNDYFQQLFRPFSKLVIHLDSILRWDMPYYPAITAALVTLFFTLLAYTDMSMVSYFFLLCILATFLDFSLPIVNDILAKDWSKDDEAQYKVVCARYSSAATDVVNFYRRFAELHRTNVKLYYVILLSVLLTFAWIGTWVSDIFFLYVISLFVSLYPGLCRQEAFQQNVGDKFVQLTSYVLPQGKDKKDK